MTRTLHRTSVLVCVGIAVSAMLSAATPAFSQSGTLDPVLRGRARQLTGRSRVIVEYRGTADVRAVTAVRGRAGRRLANRHLQIADVDNIGLAALASDPRVARVTLDRDTFTTMERTAAAVGAQSSQTDYGVTGRGVGVVIIDSGISALNDDLLVDAAGRPSPAVVHFKDFTRDENSGVWTPDLPVDDFGHGTHVAGIIRGSGYDSNGRRHGIAPESNLVGLKVLDRDGHGHISDLIDAIDSADGLKKAYNVRVINVSVGAGVVETYRLDPLAQATKRAVAAGIVVVAAAGNLGRNNDGDIQYGGITAPGNAPWVITVGASSHQGTARRSDDSIAPFSSRGPTWIDFEAKPDLVAPGVGIESLADPHSTLFNELADYRLAGTRATPFQPYLSLTGTSMAAPVVTGAVALMLQVNPSLTPNAVKAILEFTAQQRAGESALAQGAGLINVHGAIRMADFFRYPTEGRGLPGDTIEDEWVPWSEDMLWGNYLVNGGILLPAMNAWSPTVTWGALSTPKGAPVTWGTTDANNIVWSTRDQDNDNIVWSTRDQDNDNIVWITRDQASDNIVWSTRDQDNDNIVWSTRDQGNDNIVWSTRDQGNDNIVWSTRDQGTDNIVWSTRDQGTDNIVWSTRDQGTDNIVWSTRDQGTDNIVWSTRDQGNDNIVWSTAGSENIVWSTSDSDNIVWSTSDANNIVWSTSAAQNVVWGTDCSGPNCGRPVWG